MHATPCTHTTLIIVTTRPALINQTMRCCTHSWTGARQYGHTCISFEHGPHAHWWPHGAARCVFGLAKHTMHVVSPPMLDSGTAWRPVRSPTSASERKAATGSEAGSALPRLRKAAGAEGASPMRTLCSASRAAGSPAAAEPRGASSAAAEDAEARRRRCSSATCSAAAFSVAARSAATSSAAARSAALRSLAARFFSDAAAWFGLGFGFGFGVGFGLGSGVGLGLGIGLGIGIGIGIG